MTRCSLVVALPVSWSYARLQSTCVTVDISSCYIDMLSVDLSSAVADGAVFYTHRRLAGDPPHEVVIGTARGGR